MNETDEVLAQINALMAAEDTVTNDIDTTRQLSEMVGVLQGRALMLLNQPASTIPQLTPAQVTQLTTLQQNLTNAVGISNNVAGILTAATSLAKGV
jgi:hypothetical protein